MKINILLIEDNKPDAILVQNMINNINYEIDEEYKLFHIETLETSKEILESNNIDIVFLDLNLPDSSGIDTIHYFREINKDIPLVVYTGTDDLTLGKKILDSGADDYLCKNDITDSLFSKTVVLNLERYKLKQNIFHKELILMEQSKMASMGEMIGAIAHQWRQPLNSIGYILQDLISAHKHNEFTDDYFEEIKKDMMSQLNYMSDTIDQFRNYFKKDDPYKEFNLISCILSVNKIYQAQLVNSNLDITLIVNNKKINELSQEEISVFNIINQESQLQQVLINCISNAKEAILELKNIQKEQRLIEINISEEDDNIIIVTNDLAGGIDNINENRIFEPYFTTKNMGTGLGLYICKIICEKSLNGTIKYNRRSFIIDKNELYGSSFTITLPKSIKKKK